MSDNGKFTVTGLFDVIGNDDLDILEQLEEFEDKLDYIDIDINKKNVLEKIIKNIRFEEDKDKQEELFEELINKIDN